MRRSIYRRRSLVLVLVVCVLLFIFNKVIILNLSPDSDALYKSLAYSFRSNLSNFGVFRTKTLLGRQPMTKVNCAAILKGDDSEVKRAKDLMNQKNYTQNKISENDYIQATRNCDYFKASRGYGTQRFTQEERDFPIAFSILLYKDVEQAERLLRALYAPQNFFCLHVDADAKPEVHKAVDGISNCFDNVFIASRKEYIVYAGFSRLQADLTCMENLVQRGKTWEYFINLPSQEFPLKSNLEMVKILKTYNGANDIEGITGKRKIEYRYKIRYIYKRERNQVKPKVFKTSIKKDDPPHNITVIKGSAYGVFSRAFVEYVIYDKIARELLEWFRDVLSPDEYYWATLQYNHHIGTPGSFYTGKPDNKPWLAVYAGWGGVNKCAGKFVRGVCVFGVGDLEPLSRKKELFANKFYLDYQPLALDCIEEWHYNKTVNQDMSQLNMTFYAKLPFIGNSTITI